MASLPWFYYNGTLKPQDEVWLDEDTVRHVVQVLRMQPGGRLQLTNGAGAVATTTIASIQKKKCSVHIDDVAEYERNNAGLHLCVAFTKNTSRNEWLLEKATELGVHSITPLLTTRTEREKIRYDRWQNILVAAILQSQQCWLPQLHEAMPLQKVLEEFKDVPQKLMGHCIENISRAPLSEMLKPGCETVMLIGPEGDFTEDEVNLSMGQYGYRGVSMGTQRLRTETAAMAVCAYFNLINHG